jgi:hypothetical protein
MSLDAGGGPSEPSLRARLALAGNRSQRYAPAGSSDVTGWCSGMRDSSLGARPAVIIHSEEIRGVESLRRPVGYLDERHFMPLSINARPWLAFAYVGRDARCSASHRSLIHPRSEPCGPRDMLSVESIAAAVIAMRTRMLTICSVHGASPVFVSLDPGGSAAPCLRTLVHRTHVSAGTALRQAGTRLAFWDLRDERFCRE